MRANQEKFSARYIPYHLLRLHFLTCYLIIFVLPVIDLIVALPSNMMWPRQEFLNAIGLAVIHSFLVVLSYADIYSKDAYLEPEFRIISLTARITQGLAASEIAMLLIDGYFLYYSWPFIYKTIRHLYALSGGITHNSASRDDLTLLKNEPLDADRIVFIIAQSFRLFCVQSKVCLARQIRIATEKRNFSVGEKYLRSMPQYKHRFL